MNPVRSSLPDQELSLHSILFGLALLGTALDSWDQFSEVFQEHFPMPAQTEALPPITGKDIIRVARKMKDKAGGPDGITPRHLTCLPQLAIDRFARSFRHVKTLAVGPRRCVTGKFASCLRLPLERE